MSNLIIKDRSKNKISHKKLAVNSTISYKCPICEEQMFYSTQSVFTKLDYGYEIWICKKCNKKFRLCFQEILEVDKK